MLVLRAEAAEDVGQALALVGFLVTVPAGVLISGPLALWFWIGVALIGLIVPLGLELWTLKAGGTTPLALASWNDRLEVVKYLIGLGAEVNTDNHNGLSPLFCALDRGRKKMSSM